MNKCIRYKNPSFVNLDEFDDFPSKEHLSKYDDLVAEVFPVDQPAHAKKHTANLNETVKRMHGGDELYVGVTIARPGRHTYIVKYDDKVETADSPEKSGKDKFSLHRCIIQAREETIPPFVKEGKSHIAQRTFKKETSVFKDWRDDREHTFDTCFKYDVAHWKVHRLIKNVEDYTACEEILRENFARLKKIFIVQASRSGFPTINWINSADFIRDCNCLDGNVVQTTVDRLFIATNQELEKSDENPANALERYEFLEFLTRIAEKKFKETKICKTYSESL